MNANHLILFKGLVKDSNIKQNAIKSWVRRIQLFLFPNLSRRGIDKLSTSGAHRNFNE